MIPLFWPSVWAVNQLRFSSCVFLASTTLYLSLFRSLSSACSFYKSRSPGAKLGRASKRPIELHSKACCACRERDREWGRKRAVRTNERERSCKSTDAATHFACFLLLHAFHWKNTYIHTYVHTGCRFAKKKLRNKNDANAKPQHMAENLLRKFWGDGSVSVCVCFICQNVSHRFVSFCFRFASSHLVFAFFFACRIYWQPAGGVSAKGEKNAKGGRVSKRVFGLFMKNTWFLCTTVFGAWPKQGRWWRGALLLLRWP